MTWRAREDPEDQPETVKVEGGAGKANGPLPERRGETGTAGNGKIISTTLKIT